MEFKLGHHCFSEMESDPKVTSRLATKWAKENKVKIFEWPSQTPDLTGLVRLLSVFLLIKVFLIVIDFILIHYTLIALHVF